MAVYLDLAILLNFLVDFLLLLGTNRLSGFPLAPGRCALAAALGATYAAGCLLPGFRFLGAVHWRLVSLALMAGVAFGWNRSALRRGGAFALLSLTLGGAALAFGRGDFLTLVLCAGGVYLLCRLAFGETVGGREYVPVTLRFRGNAVTLAALRDTGNTLRDPITGEGVLVIDATAARKLTGLTREELAAPLETLARRPIPGLRLIPYRAVGQGAGMLLGVKMDDVAFGSRRRPAIVAFAPAGLGDRVQALTGGVL